MSLENNVAMEMPRYTCHKQVWALKIKDVVTNPEDSSALLVVEDKGFAAVLVTGEYIAKHDPQPGGYYVVYKGGYKSFSPAVAFESGYQLEGNTK
jgi:hypothetical protein